MKEKCIESIHVHTGETLKRDLQDLAMLEGRAVGEYIRTTLEVHVYGVKDRLNQINAEQQDRGAPERR